MTQFLISIPGPVFLLIYIIYAILIIIAAKKYSREDGTKNIETPEPTKLSPLDISILSNGLKGVIITSAFNLWKKNALEITDKKNTVIIKNKGKLPEDANKVEKAIYDTTSKETYYKQLYRNDFMKKIDLLIIPNKKKLQELRLAPDKDVINHRIKAFVFGFLSLVLFGGLKLYLGIQRDKPVAFLIILMIASVITLFFVIRPHKAKYTMLGKRFLQESEKRFEWLKNNNTGLSSDNNLLYGIALFGVAALVGTNMGTMLEKPYLLDQSSYSSGCSSCGGGGCSSSGCSSGCGGGCGGCGGD